MGLFSGLKKVVKKIAPAIIPAVGGFLTGGPAGAALGAAGGLAPSSSPRPQGRPGSVEAQIGNGGTAWSIGNALSGILSGLGKNKGAVAGSALQLLGGGLSDKAILEANKRSNKTTERINAKNLESQYQINRENIAMQDRANRWNVNLTKQQNAANRRSQERINNLNIAMQESVNKRNVQSQEKINNQQIALARETNRQAQANFETTRADSKSAIQDTVADALKAGINPLTAIRGGATAQAASGPSLVSPQLMAAVEQATAIEATQGEVASVAAAQGFAPTMQAPQIMPVTAFADALSDAGATLFASFANQPDPEREYLEKALLGEELKTRQRENAGVFGAGIGGTVPLATSYTGRDYGSAVDVAEGPAYVDPALRVDLPAGRPLTREPLKWGEDLETVEGRFGGEVSDWVGTGYWLESEWDRFKKKPFQNRKVNEFFGFGQ